MAISPYVLELFIVGDHFKFLFSLLTNTNSVISYICTLRHATNNALNHES
jgi:hypothetical protein